MRSVPKSAEASLFSDLAWPKMRLFGPMRADWGDGRSFLPRSTKTRAVMAVLALANEKPVKRSLLVDLLWPTRGREQAQASLRQSVHELRGYLMPLTGACLRSEREHLTLSVEHLWVDALFVDTTDLLGPEVVDVFRGPLLSDLRGVSAPFDAWILAQQDTLSDRLRQKLAFCLATSPSHDATVKMAQAILSYEATHEAAWTALAESYIDAGDAVAAVDICHRFLLGSQRPEGSAATDVHTALAKVFSKVPGYGGTLPNAIRNGATHSRRNSRAASTFPWRSAYLAVSPTRAVGNATAEFALCVDWQMMSALCKFEDLSCTPFDPGRQPDGSAQFLAAEGFDFLLESCIDQFANQDQIILRLRDLRLNGEVFWSQRVCQPASSMGLFGADFAAVLAPQVAVEISKQQTMALEDCPDLQFDVCGLVLRASRAVQRLERQHLSEINGQLTTAIKQDNRHPALLAWLAYVQLMQLGQGWLSEVGSAQRGIGELVDRSLAQNPDSAKVLSIAGHVLAFTQNRLEEGLSLQERAFSRNPNLPSAWLFSGLAHTYAGEHTQAISRFLRAKLLSPADQHAYFINTGLSLSYLLNGETDRAVTTSKDAIFLNPNFSSSFKIGVAASGYIDSARADPSLLQRLLLLEPGLTVERVLSRSPLTRHADKTRLSDGLRMAGLPR